MYDTIMTALMVGAPAGMTKETYAVHLKPAAKALWAAYQQGNCIAQSTNYTSQDVNAAYMLRYFPYYTHILETILTENPKATPLWREPADIALLGAGPAPEIVSIARYLKSKSISIAVANVHAFDINDCWDGYQETVSKKLVNSYGSIEELKFFRKVFDLRAEDAISLSVRKVIASCELVVSQNCINEVNWDDRDIVVQNLSKIFAVMKPRASMIVACRGLNYATANYILAGLATTIGKDSLHIAHGSERLLCRRVDQHLPDYILNKLFFRAPPLVDGLTLASNLEFVYIVAEKGQ